MDKKVEISMLWQIYGKLLTDKQNEYIDYYYNQDLSLSEIAENEEITRQAVRDNLKKGENNLFEYEEKLGVMKKTLEKEEKIEKIISEIKILEKENLDKNILKTLTNIKNKLNGLI